MCIPLGYQGRYWILIPKSNNGIGKKLRIKGVGLTNSGRELSKIVEIKPMDRYSQDLAQFFERNGLRMIEVDGEKPRIVDINAVTVSDSQ